MGRPLRIEYAGALYYIASRGNERKKIFLDDADRKRFLGILGEIFGRIHYSSVSKASGRLREEVISDRRLSKLVDELELHFKT